MFLLFFIPKTLFSTDPLISAFIFFSPYLFKSLPKKAFPLGVIFWASFSNEFKNCILLSLSKLTYVAYTLILCSISFSSNSLILEILSPISHLLFYSYNLKHLSLPPLFPVPFALEYNSLHLSSHSMIFLFTSSYRSKCLYSKQLIRHHSTQNVLASFFAFVYYGAKTLAHLILQLDNAVPLFVHLIRSNVGISCRLYERRHIFLC